MSKGFFFNVLLVFIFAISLIFDVQIISTVAFYTLFAMGILFLIFVFTPQKRIAKKDIIKYPLELLGNNGKNIYLIITNNEKHSLFSYLNENGEKILCDIEYAVIEFLESDEKPYVEIYENIYTPKGLVDFLYYNKKYEQSRKIRYEPHVTEDMIEDLN